MPVNLYRANAIRCYSKQGCTQVMGTEAFQECRVGDDNAPRFCHCFDMSTLDNTEYFSAHTVQCVTPAWSQSTANALPERMTIDKINTMAIKSFACKCQQWRIVIRTYTLKPKFHLARHVTSRLDTTGHVRRVEHMLLAVSSLPNSTARHVERVVSRRDVTSQVKFVLKLINACLGNSTHKQRQSVEYTIRTLKSTKHRLTALVK